MARTTARVEGNRLVLASPEENPIPMGSPAWFDWLQGVSTFTFTSPFGSFTARKEPRARGGWYWKAYRTVHGTLHRTYLGKTSDLTLDRLNDAATRLAATATPADAAISAPPSGAPATERLPSLLATKLLVPPARAQLVPRPRLFEQVARRHVSLECQCLEPWAC